MVEINNLEDLYYLITNQVGEGYCNLVYKPADALTNSEESEKEIAKDISALANTNGGIIIYGIKRYSEQNKKHFQEVIDPIDGLNFSRDWLEKVISSNVYPRVGGVIIKPISINSRDNVIYVVIISKSNTAHQASDYRYYKRYNSQSVPMYDFEIRAIMNLNNTPKIGLSYRSVDDSYEVNPMFPALLLPNDKEERSVKMGELTNDLYVYGRDIDEYMQIMLAVI